MFFIFLISLSILLYTFVGYPVVLCLLSSLLGKSVNKKKIYPYVSIIISAYNEENIIKEKLENCLNLDYPKHRLEIIVASESTDRTNDIVRDYEDKGIILYAFNKREGKRATLYKTVPLAGGDIIVFSDANAMYERDAVRKIVRNFHDGRIGCVSGRLRYINPNEAAIGNGESSYWEFDLILKKMASRLFSLAGGVNGSIFAIRKTLYDPIDRNRGDDFEISNRVEINGYGVVLEPDAVSYEESSKNSKQEFIRKVRLASWNFKSTLILLNESLKKGRLLTAFLLFSHRFLRYTTPIWLISLMASNVFLLDGNIVYLFFLQLAFYSFAFSGYVLEKTRHQKIPSLFLIPYYFCMVNFAAFVALTKNVFGKTEVVWEKAR